MPNRLADQASPYLKEAADQPVDWHPWSEAALEKARQEGKPILVDSGAVWCHWCHVMDHESYEDPTIAELINERFVPIKLDRDERPDIDRRLQQAVGAMTGRGGWPLTAFLTPEGEVYYGGTYFPPEPTGNMPSFQEVLEKASHFYEDHTDQAQEQAAKIQEALARGGAQVDPGELTLDLVEGSIEDLVRRYDAVHGGFGGAPKFPHPASHQLLMDWHALELGTGETAWEAACHTLQAMVRGGIHDHLDGGFHRYSVDHKWHVPHFEKMLYDNAGLLSNLAQAATLARAKDQEVANELLTAARGTAGFLLEILGLEDGGFGGSQDADRRPEAEGPLRRHDLEDGEYFTWTLDEVQEVLDGDVLRVATLHWGIGESGDMDHDPSQNVLQIEATAEDIAETLDRPVGEVQGLIEAARGQLHAARHAQEAPIVDPTLYVNWNGMAIQALLQLDRLHDAPEARQAALRALDRILETAWDPDLGFHHAIDDQGARVTGLLDDQAQMLPALLEAHLTTQEETYLARASQVADVILERFTDEAGLLTETDQRDQAARPADQPTASPVATVLDQLPRLARLTGEARYREQGEELLEALAGEAERLDGTFGGSLFLAILHHLEPAPHTVVVGHGQLLETAQASPWSRATVVQVEEPEAPGVPEEATAAAEAFEGEHAAIVCSGRSCQLAKTVGELEALLRPPALR